jgi:hypothetical protein
LAQFDPHRRHPGDVAGHLESLAQHWPDLLDENGHIVHADFLSSVLNLMQQVGVIPTQAVTPTSR